MNQEDISTTKGWIRNGLLLSELPQIDKALAGLEDLCAAAINPQDMVGRSVRRREADSTGTVIDYKAEELLVKDSLGRELWMTRDDIHLLPDGHDLATNEQPKAGSDD